MTYAGLTKADKPALLDAKSKGYDSAYLNFDGYPERVMVDLALAQIAEMESEQNNMLSEKASEKCCAEMESAEKPLTCDGCKREEAKKDYMHVICMQCTRMNQTRDRYEPKGEKE